MSAVRVVTLADGRRVRLGEYVRSIKVAIGHPDHLFPAGLNGWPQTGAEIRREFRRGMHERINAR